MDDVIGRRHQLRLRNLEVRLARGEDEIVAAQSLRYDVFYREMNARPTPEAAASGRDSDSFDALADHLLVIDHDRGHGPDSVVGTYRLIRGARVPQGSNFYTAGEFNIEPLLQHDGEVLELGRSCVHRDYRSGPILQLLWRGIAAYVAHYDVMLMFGCASLPGTDPATMADELSYLYYHHLAPPAFRTRALAERYVDMRFRDAKDFDPRIVAANLPPLIKGYLRVGGFVGDGAVVDEQFNTTDVCVVVKTDLITEKYARHYNRDSDSLRTVMGGELE